MLATVTLSNAPLYPAHDVSLHAVHGAFYLKCSPQLVLLQLCNRRVVTLRRNVSVSRFHQVTVPHRVPLGSSLCWEERSKRRLREPQRPSVLSAALSPMLCCAPVHSTTLCCILLYFTTLCCTVFHNPWALTADGGWWGDRTELGRHTHCWPRPCPAHSVQFNAIRGPAD